MFSYLRNAFSVLMTQRKKFFWFALIGVLSEIAVLYIPHILKNLVAAIEQRQPAQLVEALRIGLTIGLAYVFLDWLYEITTENIRSSITVHQEKRYREKYLHTNYQRIEEVGTGRMSTKLLKGTSAETGIALSYRDILLRTMFRGGVIFYILRTSSTVVGIIATGVLGGVVGLHFLVDRFIQPFTKKLQELNEETSRDFVRIATHHLLITIAGKIRSVMHQGNTRLDQFPPLETRISLLQGIPYNFIHLCVRTGEILIYFFLGTLVIEGTYALSTVIMYGTYIWVFRHPLASTISNLSRISKDREAIKALHEFFALPNPLQNGTTQFMYQGGDITFENVRFGYGTKKDVFQSLSLTISGQKKTALVGESGGGKSTLLKLILRLYDPHHGRITIQNQDLPTLDLHSYYHRIGYLTQEPVIFDGTIHENLTFFIDRNPTPQQIQSALELARCDFVYELTQGLQTEVGERGIKLSGGQRQRLAIAALFLKNPDIVLLDEPTSALDSLSEQSIIEAMQNLFQGRTVIIIAHRLQTVKSADNIIVLNQGEIVERGTHIDLTAKGGYYARMLELQSGF